MAEWKKFDAQADKAQQEADYLYEQAEAARCPQNFNKTNGYGVQRCKRDINHVGDHHLENS